MSGDQIRKSFLAACALVAVSAAPSAAVTLCDSLATGRYDIIYVCPAAWRTQVARLAIHRSQFSGYSTVIATLEGIAPCYGAGRLGLRNLLAHTIQSWSSPPIHVVLVGAYGNADTTQFIIPTWLIPDPTVGFWTSFVPTDDPYVFAPASPDSTPVVSIGRIPVWNVSDVAAYVDKVIAYDSQGLAAWKRYSLHVIEDRDLEGNSGTVARLHADSLANYFSWRYSYNFYRSSVYATAVDLAVPNRTIIPPWNAGLGFALFYGTSGHYDLYAFFDHNSICGSPSEYNCNQFPCQGMGDSLQTNGYTPVVFAMTCGNGYSSMVSGSPSTCGKFSNWLLATPGKGAVVVTGPARALHEIPGYAIAREWFTATFGPAAPATSEPGEVLRQVKANLMPSGLRRFKNEILQMTVLGDPALGFFVGKEPVVGVGGPARVPIIQFAMRPAINPAGGLSYRGDFPEAGGYDLRVYDIMGREVSSTLFAAPRPVTGAVVRLPDSGLGNGIYFLVARRGSMVAATKLILLR